MNVGHEQASRTWHAGARRGRVAPVAVHASHVSASRLSHNVHGQIESSVRSVVALESNVGQLQIHFRLRDQILYHQASLSRRPVEGPVVH